MNATAGYSLIKVTKNFFMAEDAQLSFLNFWLLFGYF